MISRAVLVSICAFLGSGLVSLAGLANGQPAVGPSGFVNQLVSFVSGENGQQTAVPDVDRSRADCPGRVICPLTGKPVCKDRCPLGAHAKGATIKAPAVVDLDPKRANCPGRVICPLTGKPVCKDRCPLGKGHAKIKNDSNSNRKHLPSCCRKGK